MSDELRMKKVFLNSGSDLCLKRGTDVIGISQHAILTVFTKSKIYPREIRCLLSCLYFVSQYMYIRM